MPEQPANQPGADGSDGSDRLSAKRRRLRPSGGYRKLRSYKDYARWLEHPNPAVVANTLVCLIHQANYLLDQQISALERDFVREGGYSEQLAAARIVERQKQQRAAPSSVPPAPICRHCGKPMALRTALKGERAGSQFWGWSGFPECKGTRALEGSGGSD